MDTTEPEDPRTPDPDRTGTNQQSVSRTISIPTPNSRTERQPLRTPGSRFSEPVAGYGSIIATPPQQAMGSDTASFELPDPAIDPDEDYVPPMGTPGRRDEVKTPSPVMSRHATFGNLSSHPAADDSPGQPVARAPTWQSPKGKSSLENSSSAIRTSQLLRRVFSQTENEPLAKRAPEISNLEVQRRQDEFFAFLDGELNKIDSFYQMKEREATDRLKVLRQQLHAMRDQRTQELMDAKRTAKRNNNELDHRPSGFSKLKGSRLKDTLIGKTRFGKNSQALAEMATPGMQARDREFIVNRRDFMRRQDPPNNDVSYRSAKRKLKHALQEFYRGIELLKGYAYLNRTAFRKINKKYDKAVNARPPQRFMSEKVNKACFVQSEVIESLMAAVEDLYARYFERGNRKLAASKLRHKMKSSGDYSPSAFRSGLLLMAGTLFAIQALVYAAQHLRNAQTYRQTQTSYLLQVGVSLLPRSRCNIVGLLCQIYGGYFLIVLHTLLFALDCMIWTNSKINYAFVFEYDTRHTLEWRQLLEVRPESYDWWNDLNLTFCRFRLFSCSSWVSSCGLISHGSMPCTYTGLLSLLL